MLTVVCVLKSGGDYDKDYVLALKRDVAKHIGDIPYKFVCYTDQLIPGTSIHMLSEGLDGWFSKFEVFKELGPVLYFDLDTVIVGSLAPLAEKVMEGTETFWMLEAFSPLHHWASGIMGWTGNWRWLLPDAQKYVGLYPGDQECIVQALKVSGKVPETLVREELGIYSYKHHCWKGLPPRAKVICFHGKPRPKDVEETWVKI